jgi:hypothetical protein
MMPLVYLKNQRNRAEDFAKLPVPSPRRLTRLDGSFIDRFQLVSHCPLCCEPTELRAKENDAPDWHFMKSIGIHRCSCHDCIDGYIYFTHAVGVWYKRDPDYDDLRIGSFETIGLIESRPSFSLKRFFKKFLRDFV